MATTAIERAPYERAWEIVLETVRAVMRETGGLEGGHPVTLDDALDRDLGLGSLERVEIVSRLEEALQVSMPEAVVAEARTPRELVEALLSAGPAVVKPTPAPRVALRPAPAAPAFARTLVEVLEWHVGRNGERPHVFLREEDGRERAITYGALFQHAAAIAAGLRERGVGPGERVALVLRTEADFFYAFFGVLLAGGVPVPLYPPFRADRIEEYARRQLAILNNAHARALLTFPEAERVAHLLEPRVDSLEFVATVGAVAAADARPRPVALASGDVGLIQYTSGSTGDPKGVLLTHANLLANIRAIGEAIAIAPDDVAVSWLPLYHDMGLIGSWLGALYHGVPIVILSPIAFLTRPARWLQAIHAHRGTISAAPNFAFDLCARKVREQELAGLDLGSWRLALNGSEAVCADTIERFIQRFGPHGFRAEAMAPVYGLAEASVALTMPPVGRAPRVDAVDRAAFSLTRRAQPTTTAAAAPPLRFVSCGRPVPGHEVRIVDATAAVLGERVEGRIEFRGPSVTSGYFRRPDLTQAALHDGWMDSGDLGYWADGELYVTGRRKDLIIKAGRNLYPQEVEELVGDVPGARKGCVAAFGVPDPAVGTERLVVVAETRETTPAARETLRRAVLDRVVATLGVPADSVVVCGPGTVLKTSSGKIRRSATRDAYVRGVLTRRTSKPAQWLRLVGAHVRARAGAAGARAVHVVYALYLGVVLSCVLPTLAVLVWLLPGAGAVDRVTRLACRAILALAGCRLTVRGAEHLSAAEPVVLVANHASYVDAIALLAAVPQEFRFVAKRELLSSPLVGRIIRRVGHLAVERGDLGRSVTDAERASAMLRGGTSLLFFAEGTFVQSPRLLPFKLGAFKAAVENARPVVPVTLAGTREILPANRWIPTPGPIVVTIGRPIPSSGASGWPEMVRLRAATYTAIARELREVPLAALR
jgi:1-acyl-sn-glycerol-3-phosphate acyltransferase